MSLWRIEGGRGCRPRRGLYVLMYRSAPLQLLTVDALWWVNYKSKPVFARFSHLQRICGTLYLLYRIAKFYYRATCVTHLWRELQRQARQWGERGADIINSLSGSVATFETLLRATTFYSCSSVAVIKVLKSQERPLSWLISFLFSILRSEIIKKSQQPYGVCTYILFNRQCL